MEAGRLATGRRALSPRADVESELGRLEEDGRLAKQELLEANLRLVVSLAARYRGRGMTFLDLVAAGSAGLVRAISSFDQSSRDRFTGRAEWYVRRAIARAVEDRAAGTTSVPITRLDVVNGDARDAELVEGAVAGRDGLISVLALPSGEREFEHSEATSVIVGAALRSSVRRVIVTTCADVFSDGEVTGDRAPYAREDERNRDELRASRLDWTIGAAPGVTDDLPVGVYEAVIDASAPGKRLAAADLATFTLDALEQEEWIGHIVGVSN
jgi:RNA polymerase sigma factor (sigma-70 family)